MRFAEYKNLDLVDVGRRVEAKWKIEDTFRKVLENSQGAPAFIFCQVMVPFMQLSGNRVRLVRIRRNVLIVTRRRGTYFNFRR